MSRATNRYQTRVEQEYQRLLNRFPQEKMKLEAQLRNDDGDPYVCIEYTLYRKEECKIAHCSQCGWWFFEYDWWKPSACPRCSYSRVD